MDDIAAIFSLNNWPGHLSYALIAVSYWLTDMFWLRLVAIVGLSLEILYFLFTGGDLRTGIGWDLVFIAINAYQLYRILQDRLSLACPRLIASCSAASSPASTMHRLRGCSSLGGSAISPRARRWPKKASRSTSCSSFARAMCE